MGRDSTNQRIDMTGVRSGKLIVVGPGIGPTPKRAYWICKCDCGGMRTVMGKYLRNEEVKSCGCLNRTSLLDRTTHGFTRTGMVKPRAYTSWSGMKDRCLNPNNHKWRIYGGRGIKVCDSWIDFENFYADMGDPPAGMSIDRIDVNGDYCKLNCRWATPQQQANNTRLNRWIQYDGRTQSLSAWAREFNINPSSLHGQLARYGEQEAIRKHIR